MRAFQKLALFLILCLSQFSFASKDKTSEVYWQESGVTLKMIASVLNNKGCYSSVEYYSGCMAGLNTLLRKVNVQLNFVLKSETDATNELLIEKDFGLSVEKIDNHYIITRVDLEGAAVRAGLTVNQIISLPDGDYTFSDSLQMDELRLVSEHDSIELAFNKDGEEIEQIVVLRKTALQFGPWVMKYIKADDEGEEGLSITERWSKVEELRKKENSSLATAYELSKEAFSSHDADKLSKILYFPYTLAKISVLLDKGSEPKWPMYAGEIINKYTTTSKDAHSSFVPTEQFMDGMKATDKVFAGIGVEIMSIGGKVIIKKVLKNLGAEAVGLKINDEVFMVDDKALRDKNIKYAVDQLVSEVGTTVKVEVLRGGESILNEITRMKMVIKNVEPQILDYNDFKVGSVVHKSFVRRDSCDEIAAAFEELKSEGADGYIFDLRSNPGGLLKQSTCILGLMVGLYKVASTTRTIANFPNILPLMTYTTKSKSFLSENKSIPIVVLINSQSASASEIVAGAIQDHERAWIVGERSFGKGTAQSGIPVKNKFLPGLKLTQFITIQKYFLPSGRSIQLQGVTPDFEVPIKPDANDEDRFALREAELFPNALTNNDPLWEQTRADEISSLKNCVEETGALKGRWTDDIDADEKFRDYQQLYASDIIRCSLRARAEKLAKKGNKKVYKKRFRHKN